MGILTRCLTAGALGAALLTGLVACSPADQANAGSEGAVVLHRGNGAEPSSLDPHKAAGTWENNIIGDLFLGLYTDDVNAEPVLGAAEAHDISEDGLTHTFTIREGLVWSDGEPVTAYDFEYSLRRIMNPTTAARYASLLYLIENAEAVNTGEMPVEALGVRAIDDRTFEMRLNRPAAFLPALLTHYTTFALPRHVVEEYGDAWTRPENMVTNGAYTLEEWVPNDHILTAKNPLFYDAENVAIDEVIFYPTDDESAALRRFRAGELDMNAGFPSQQYAWLVENMPGETHVAAYIATTYLSINMRPTLEGGRPNPLLDQRVRTALALAINRETIADRIMRTGQIPAFTLVPPEMPDYTPPVPEMAHMSQQERIEIAQRLMREAGYGPENRLSFTYRYRESVDNRRVAVGIAGFWEDIFVDVDLVNTEPAVHYLDLEQGNFTVADAGWIADYPDPENYLFLLDSSSGLLNYGNYENPQFDALLAQAQQMSDVEARAAVLAQAEAILMEDLPLIPTVFGVSRTLVGQHIQGYEDNLVHIHRTRFMSIDESLRPVQPSLIDRVTGWFN